MYKESQFIYLFDTQTANSKFYKIYNNLYPYMYIYIYIHTHTHTHTHTQISNMRNKILLRKIRYLRLLGKYYFC